MNWTLACNGTEKLLSAWGLTQFTRRLVSQGQDELTFKADGALADSPPLFVPFVSSIIVYRDRQIALDGSYTGGMPWFQGLVIQVPRAGSPRAESLFYKAAGPWWYLDNLVFLAPYLNVLLAYTPGDPTSAIFGAANTSHVFLNYDVTGSTPAGLLKSSSGKQIIAALEWALKPFVDAGAAAPFQIGRVTPNADPPIDEVRDITCAEVINKMLRWTPDAVTWFDYTTVPPTFNCARRGDLPAPITLALNSQPSTVNSLRIRAREDLQSPYVLIWYETQNTINGASQITGTKDVWPNPPPTAPQDQFNALVFTVNLQGFQSNTTFATIACDPIAMDDPKWWLGRHPQYRAYDPTNAADAGNPIARFELVPDSWQRTPILNEADKGYGNELTTGQLAPWMTFKSQRITISARATITYRNGKPAESVPLTFQCLSTNAYSGTYSNETFSAFPEPAPVGLARAIYDAVSVRHFEGEITLQEPEVSGALTIGNLFNLTGGALAEWAAMEAMVLEVEENLDTGTTVVRFGPPRQLGAGDLVELLRVNRFRLITSPYTLPVTGAAGAGGETTLGSNTPEKNSSGAAGWDQKQVISNTIDAVGPLIIHDASDPSTCSSVWTTNPGANAVTINLADAAGNSLRIQPLKVCQNGLSGTVYFLCSGFIPDTP